MPSNQLTIPVQLLEHASKKAILPELKVFLGAKMVSSGYINDKSVELNNLCTLVGFQRRTLLKHLDHLVKLQWVGYDIKEKRYYIRSWAYLRSEALFYERGSAPFNKSDLLTFRAFIAGVIISYKVRKQEYAFKQLANEKDDYKLKIIKKIRKSSRGKASKSVTNIGRVTSQDSDAHSAIFNQLPEYNGFSNAHIGVLLNCKPTNACNLKHEAEKAGYIRTQPRLKIIQTLPDGPDHAIRSQYYKALGEDARKLRFSTELIGRKKILCLVEQLHDEIVPLISFRRIKYLKMLPKKRLNEIKPC